MFSDVGWGGVRKYDTNIPEKTDRSIIMYGCDLAAWAEEANESAEGQQDEGREDSEDAPGGTGPRDEGVAEIGDVFPETGDEIGDGGGRGAAEVDQGDEGERGGDDRQCAEREDVREDQRGGQECDDQRHDLMPEAGNVNRQFPRVAQRKKNGHEAECYLKEANLRQRHERRWFDGQERNGQAQENRDEIGCKKVRTKNPVEHPKVSQERDERDNEIDAADFGSAFGGAGERSRGKEAGEEILHEWQKKCEPPEAVEGQAGECQKKNTR